MESLKIGDKVCYVRYSKWGEGVISYTFDEVGRVTKTLAILKSGKRLVNIPLRRHFSKDIEYYFSEYADNNTNYQIVTEKLLQECEFHKKYSLAKSWFAKYIFTNDQILEIFEKYEQKNQSINK
jgi:hypothetical protein